MGIFQSRLREMRKTRKLAQSALGRLAGCGQEKISSYETGKGRPQYQTLVHLADALQVSTDYLLGRTDEMERKITLEDILAEDELDLLLKYRGLSR